ncbi:hypothetical protein V2S84_19000, partial [Azotobacter chroococcum]|nr:hypothetical protein [Azotobacter chroococcum]
EIWGEGLPTAATQLPYGGNGVNHPTSIGAAAIYTPAVEAADFRSQSEEVVLSIEADIAKLPSLETYADNAAALAGGLTAGKLYKTATGELRVVY